MLYFPFSETTPKSRLFDFLLLNSIIFREDYPDERLVFWEGESFKLADELSLIRVGGHFPGGTVLHWSKGANEKGVLLSADIIQVAVDNTRVSFMHSYPNMLPLAALKVQYVGKAIELWDFDRLYGAFDGKTILSGAKKIISDSVSRYLELLEDKPA